MVMSNLSDKMTQNQQNQDDQSEVSQDDTK